MRTFIKNNILPLTLCLLIIIAFLFLQPTSVSSLNLNNKQATWNTFIKKINGQRMDTKLFWETREFYSPGYFIFNKEGLGADKQRELLKQVGVSELDLTNQLVVSEYTAPALLSYESLVPDKKATSILNIITKLSERKDVLAKGQNFVIIKTKPNKAEIIFLATLEEMKKANGFFEYNKEDKDFVKGKSWFDVSTITTN